MSVKRKRGMKTKPARPERSAKIRTKRVRNVKRTRRGRSSWRDRRASRGRSRMVRFLIYSVYLHCRGRTPKLSSSG